MSYIIIPAMNKLNMKLGSMEIACQNYCSTKLELKHFNGFSGCIFTGLSDCGHKYSSIAMWRYLMRITFTSLMSKAIATFDWFMTNVSTRFNSKLWLDNYQLGRAQYLFAKNPIRFVKCLESYLVSYNDIIFFQQFNKRLLDTFDLPQNVLKFNIRQVFWPNNTTTPDGASYNLCPRFLCQSGAEMTPTPRCHKSTRRLTRKSLESSV